MPGIATCASSRRRQRARTRAISRSARERRIDRAASACADVHCAAEGTLPYQLPELRPPPELPPPPETPPPPPHEDLPNALPELLMTKPPTLALPLVFMSIMAFLYQSVRDRISLVIG